MRESAHRQFIVSRGSIDEVVGIVRKEDILELCLDDKPFDLMQVVQKPVAVYEDASILDTLEMFKSAPVEMALMIDEYGSLQGIVTQTDFLEAIAGDLPEAQTEEPEVKELADGSLLIDGGISIYDAQQRLGLDMLSVGHFNCRVRSPRLRPHTSGW